MHGPQEAGFEITGTYDAASPLVIDPVLWYSTFLGGNNGDSADAIAVDGAGMTYITGTTYSTSFSGGSFVNSDANVFVLKLGPTASAAETPAVIYSTFLGGDGSDDGAAIATDGNGNAYVTGKTRSANFPRVTPFQATLHGVSDAFVTKINANGTALVYSTYLGGLNSDAGSGIAVYSGRAQVTGRTGSTDFPTTSTAFRRTIAGLLDDAFVTKFNSAGTSLDYSTYLGSSPNDVASCIATDRRGFIYVAGTINFGSSVPVPFPTKAPPGQSLPPFQSVGAGAGQSDVFVAKIDPFSRGENSLIYATLLSGSGNDTATAIIVDAIGQAYVVGYTSSPNFPQKISTLGLTAAPLLGIEDAFITKFNADGTAVLYSLLVGGTGSDRASGVGLDQSGTAWISGYTNSSDFPVSADALQPVFGGGRDAFVTRIVSHVVLGFNDGKRTGTAFGPGFSTYLGSADEEANALAVDSGGNIYVAGLYDGGGLVRKIGRVDQPPAVRCSVTTNTLWPPNSQLVNVGLQVTATDDHDPAPTIHIAVFSDETDADAGGAVIWPDATNFAPGALTLRAERNGNGDGRVYFILVTATDAAGNVGYSCCTATVPHSQSANAEASVAAQAAAAEAECAGSGNAPAGYFPLSPVPVSGARR